MFTIFKIYKIQTFLFNERLGGGNPFEDFAAHNDNNIPQQGTELVGKKLRGTLHDIYTLPYFNDFTDINNFLVSLEGIDVTSNPNIKQELIRDLILAYKLSIKYLESEGYYLPNFGKDPKTQNDLISITEKGQKFKNIRDRIAYCTLLKEILGFFRIIRYGKFSVNYETGEIDLRNKDFMKQIIGIFSDNNVFEYTNPDDVQFSNKSDSMSGTALIDGKKIKLYAGFRVKSINAMVEKMDGQEKYNLPEAFKDIHGLRVEVSTSEDALRIAKHLFKTLGGDLKLENVGSLVSRDEFDSYSSSFTVDEADEQFQKAMNLALNTPEDEKKPYSEDRQELKLTRKGEHPIEIQIALVNNKNETGYAHHDVYKIRRKIAAKIRRHGWVSKKGIKTIIRRVFEYDAMKHSGKSTIPFTEEQIYRHIIGLPGFLIGIKGASEISRESAPGENGQIRFNHYSTKEVIEKYKENYPNSTAKDPISIVFENNDMTTISPISQINFLSQEKQRSPGRKSPGSYLKQLQVDLPEI